MSRPRQITREAAMEALRAHTDRNEGNVQYVFGDVATHLRLHEEKLSVVEVLVQNATHWAFHDHLCGVPSRRGVPLHGSDGSTAYSLITKDYTVEWDEAKVLDLPALMAEPAEHGWGAKLATALQTLEITPNQEKPAWLLCTAYG